MIKTCRRAMKRRDILVTISLSSDLGFAYFSKNSILALRSSIALGHPEGSTLFVNDGQETTVGAKNGGEVEALDHVVDLIDDGEGNTSELHGDIEDFYFR